jgi:hypothetical protein
VDAPALVLGSLIPVAVVDPPGPVVLPDVVPVASVLAMPLDVTIVVVVVIVDEGCSSLVIVPSDGEQPDPAASAESRAYLECVTEILVAALRAGGRGVTSICFFVL